MTEQKFLVTPERARCEAEIPGYREARHHPTWSEVRDEYLAQVQADIAAQQ